MTDLFSLLKIKFVSRPYDDPNFVKLAQALLSRTDVKKEESVRRLLVELSILEIESLAETDIQRIVYRACAQRLYKWIETEHTVHVLQVFVEISAEGLPVVQVLYTLLLVVNLIRMFHMYTVSISRTRSRLLKVLHTRPIVNTSLLLLGTNARITSGSTARSLGNN